MTWRNLLLALMMGCLARTGAAQDSSARPPDRAAGAMVVPQIRNPAGPSQKEQALGDMPRVAVRKVSAHVAIQNDLAETRLQFQCVNLEQQAVQVPIAVPLPSNARLANISDSPAEPYKLLPAQEALAVWQNLAKQWADPAPLEFCGLPLLKTQPVDLPAGKPQPVTLIYTLSCPSSGPRRDYVLPRSESVEYAIPWSMQVDLQADQPISTVYSPSHKLQTKRLSAHSLHVNVEDREAAQPGGFWLSYLLDQGGVSATLFTQPDETTSETEGTFLFLAGIPAEPTGGKAIPRELTLALDHSGSMQGTKIEQVRSAATHVLECLNEGEAFNIITYSTTVQSFADKPVRKSPETLESALEFIDSVKPRGGTNLHGALLQSVRQKPAPGTLPIVLFLTDGLPTAGETRESNIRELIATQNPHHQRIFTVGVGVDVNTPLLEAIAGETRAQPTFVLPTENVKTKVSQLFQSLERPILADARLEILDARGEGDPNRVRDVFPNPLPDLFQDDHLVVLGRYRGTDPLTFRIQGNYLGTRKSFEFTFPLQDQPSYPFVSRLWATQKIAALVQEIRKSGATADPYDILANPKQDPKLKRLAEEVLKLTTRYGILTEYTAFLAKDGNGWLNPSQQLDMAYRNFDERAVKTRVGLSSVNQSLNNTALKREYSLNGGNYYWDADMQRVGVPNVQQLGNGAFFRRGTTWVDGRLADRPQIAPAQIVIFGSAAHQKILNRLVEKNEHAPLSLSGNVLMEIDDKPVLIRAPVRTETPQATPFGGR